MMVFGCDWSRNLERVMNVFAAQMLWPCKRENKRIVEACTTQFDS